jgi:hypothetical protein
MKTRFIIAASFFSLLMVSPSWAQDSRYGNHRNHGVYVKEDAHHKARFYQADSRRHRGHSTYHRNERSYHRGNSHKHRGHRTPHRNERIYHAGSRHHFALRGRQHYSDSYRDRRWHRRHYLSGLDHHEDYRRHDVYKAIAGTILLNEALHRRYR